METLYNLAVGCFYIVYAAVYTVSLLLDFVVLMVREVYLFVWCEVPYHVWQWRCARAAERGDWAKYYELRG